MNMLEDSVSKTIQSAVDQLGPGPLIESKIIEHIHPLFSRVLERNKSSNEIYLANHSLGRPMDGVAQEVQRALDAWYTDLDGAWSLWINQRDHYRKLIASLINIDPWRSVVPKTSAGQGLRTAINALPNAHSKPKIVSTKGEFDSIDFTLKAYQHKGRAELTWIESDDTGLYHAQDIINAIDSSTDLVVLSLVCFVTGQQIIDIPQIIELAHKNNAFVLIDAYHAFGTIPIDMNELNPDFIIGGNYKYTRGGPGACFLAIHPKHHQSAGIPDQDSMFSIDTGWFAKQDTFAYRRTPEPEYARGGDAWLESTPPILTYFQSAPGLELTKAIRVDRLRAYSLAQQQLMIDALIERGLNPRVLEHRGAFFLIETDDGASTMKELNTNGINIDARPCPRTGKWQTRFCPDLLNTTPELIEACDRIARVFNS